ncbi:alanine racemase [Calidithermus chliarophilus]|uniref:alanine racemase n=1 Tax=Calidithermus chliarophilus TaxID=52023 RepID=UPI00040B9DDD|nr:alanine racemase [Calidithermus chliarophilus]
MLRDQGQPHTPYFAALNRLLRAEGPGRPVLLIDLERLERNLERVRATFPRHAALRIVNKSLPSPKLLEHVLKASGTRRQMVFHLPFLLLTARLFPEADVLLGKPLPARAVEGFYRHLPPTGFDPGRQLQWLVDTAERLGQYLALARGLGVRLRVNLEIDVGLHRGGFPEPAALAPALRLIRENPERLEFAGFMGYDAHVGKLPGFLEKPEVSLAKSQAAYRAFAGYLRSQFPDLWSPGLTFNGAGSPTFRLHGEGSPLNDVALGSALLKPLDFDLPLLADLEPAVFIATPVLKVLEGTTLPGLERFAPLLSRLNPNWARTHFIYGGRWPARPVSPAGLAENPLYGKSFNQAIFNGSGRTALEPDDYVFLRPYESESVLLQFGDLRVVREGRIVATWPVFSEEA